jgi:hypothetical protein
MDVQITLIDEFLILIFLLFIYFKFFSTDGSVPPGGPAEPRPSAGQTGLLLRKECGSHLKDTGLQTSAQQRNSGAQTRDQSVSEAGTTMTPTDSSTGNDGSKLKSIIKKTVSIHESPCVNTISPCKSLLALDGTPATETAGRSGGFVDSHQQTSLHASSYSGSNSSPTLLSERPFPTASPEPAGSPVTGLAVEKASSGKAGQVGSMNTDAAPISAPATPAWQPSDTSGRLYPNIDHLLYPSRRVEPEHGQGPAPVISNVNPIRTTAYEDPTADYSSSGRDRTGSMYLIPELEECKITTAGIKVMRENSNTMKLPANPRIGPNQSESDRSPGLDSVYINKQLQTSQRDKRVKAPKAGIYGIKRRQK